MKRHFKGPINVLEVGSGNSKFLYSLFFEGLLKNGYGIEISESRFNFANKWKKQLGAESITNFNENALTFNISKIPQIDLIYCVDLAFQFFEPVKNEFVKVTDFVEVVEAIAVFTVSVLLFMLAV